MFGGLIFATVLMGQGPMFGQFRRISDDTVPGKKPDAALPAAPTPWFTKDEDTFDLPTDPRHLADLKGDVADGKKAAWDVIKEEGASKDMAYQERVERIGQIIAHIANHTHATALWGDKRFSPFHYHYTVLKGDDINAFSLPGGYIFVYEGLMNFVESDDELAGVLAHETAHAAFRHVATLRDDAAKQQFWQIPAVIAAILAHSFEGATGVSLLAQAQVSGWQINAEKAADYGGFQFMEKSPYNPVAMLTFMERLALQYGFFDRVTNNTVMQTHPITRERAQAMLDDLRAAGIPVIRSKASEAFRVMLKDRKDGSVDAFFNKTKIYTFAGAGARSRAESAATKLDSFYDSVPEVFQVSENEEASAVCFKGEPVLTIAPQDAQGLNTTPSKLLDGALTAIKGSLFNLNYLLWQPEGS